MLQQLRVKIITATRICSEMHDHKLTKCIVILNISNRHEKVSVREGSRKEKFTIMQSCIKKDEA